MIALLEPVYTFISGILAAFFQVTHSYVASIALLTIVIMVVVLPLTLKSTKSMLELQQLQPEMKRIQQQYSDAQQRNEAVMALYKEHKVSPLGGCVPMLLPLPVFIVMYRIIAGLVRTCSPKLAAQAPFAGNAKLSTDPVTLSTQFCPEHVGSGTELFESLVGKTKMSSLGLNLAEHTLTTIRDNVVRGIPYILLVLVVTGTSYYQQRQVTVRSTTQVVNPQQQMLLKVMPIVFGGFSLFFPAALIVYWLVQNVFRIGQNSYITRRFYGEGGLGHRAAAASQVAKELHDKSKAEKAKAEPRAIAQSAGGRAKAPQRSGKPGARPSKPGPKSASTASKSPPKPGPKPSPKANAGQPETPAPKAESKPASNGAKASRPTPQRPKPNRPAPSRPKPNEK
jgi:YidC/Oxa1 family membrane protein insertase